MITQLRRRQPMPESAPALLDARERPLRDIRISLTDHCNLRCTYCMPKEAVRARPRFPAVDKLLTFEEIATLVQIIAGLGLRKVKLTGASRCPALLGQLIQHVREAAPESRSPCHQRDLARAASRLPRSRARPHHRSLDTLSPTDLRPSAAAGSSWTRSSPASPPPGAPVSPHEDQHGGDPRHQRRRSRSPWRASFAARHHSTFHRIHGRRHPQRLAKEPVVGSQGRNPGAATARC